MLSGGEWGGGRGQGEPLRGGGLVNIAPTKFLGIFERNGKNMKIAFDLDGTISRNPALFYQLQIPLVREGHKVVVLTAAAGELLPDQRPAEVYRRLTGIGFHCLPEQIVCCEGWEKGQKCRELGVNLLVDDSDDVIARVRSESPGTLVFKIVP